MTSAASLVERQQAKILDVGHVDADDEEDEADETLPPDDVTQQMVRRRQADGTQALSGALRIDFAGGERTVTAHLAFCPSFDGPPEFSAAAMAGPGGAGSLGASAGLRRADGGQTRHGQPRRRKCAGRIRGLREKE